MMDDMTSRLAASVDEVLPLLRTIRDELYQRPEIGGEEAFASARLAGVLKDSGFAVTMPYGGIPFAFRAAASGGKGPKAALFAEYDALPGLGHACGHNLICTAALGAALALRPVIGELGGTIYVFGTPGEENLCTKTALAEQGLFDDLDAALMVHPNPVTCSSGRTRAVEALQIEFFGRTAHAATAAEQGINALDAAVECYQMIRTETAKYPEANVHGIIDEGGKKPSVIPDYSSLKYLTRAWDMKTLEELRSMVEYCAGQAAASTGCTYRVHNYEPTNQSMRTNRQIAQVFDQYLLTFGEPEILHQDVAGSTDMADVSWRVPAIHPWVGLNCQGTELHTQAFAERTLSPEADQFLARCAKALACTTAQLLMDRSLLASVRKEFRDSSF